MKANRRIIALLTILCSVWATSLPGQTIYTWTGLGDGTNFIDPNNWTPNGLPSGSTQDIAQWDGLTIGNVLVTMGTLGLPATGFATLGINLNLTSLQTNSVQIISSVSASGNIGLFNINISSNAGAFILGDATANNLRLVTRPAGAIHDFVNNSTNAAIINPSVSWLAGGGNGYTVDFSGTGDWIVNSDLLPDNSAYGPTLIQADGPGTVYWFGGRAGLYSPNSALGTVTLNGGALLINCTNPAASTVVNGGTLGGSGTCSGPVTLAAGTTLAPGASIGSVGQLTINNNLSIGGNIVIDINKSLPSSNDFVMVTGTLTNAGAGILSVSNLGPPLAYGDKFTLFNKPLPNGGALVIRGAGALWTNNLAVDGSISPIGPSLNFAATNTATTLQFSWVGDFGNFKLQVQTNGLSANWTDYPAGTSGVIVPIAPTNGAVFFRLVPVPPYVPLENSP